MEPDLFDKLREILIINVPPLKISSDTDKNFELKGTKEVMQGKQKVDGIYFASIVPKEKDVRFYFFPLYTHPQEFTGSFDEVKKLLKGKSCFHIKTLSPETEKELSLLVKKGIEVYKKEKLI